MIKFSLMNNEGHLENQLICKIGYHGTSVSNADLIKSNGFTISQNESHWLGQGVYFFEDDFHEAERWTLYVCKRANGVVFKARIIVKENNYLDLNTRSGIKRLNDWFEGGKLELSQGIVLLPSSDEDEYRLVCTLIDLSVPPHIHVISKAISPTDDEKWGSTYIDKDFRDLYAFRLTHTQICVRELSCIEIIKDLKVEKDEKFKRITRSIG